ncbi:hypothetical protein MMPV_009398 [Pyropia vietnamensis]
MELDEVLPDARPGGATSPTNGSLPASPYAPTDPPAGGAASAGPSPGSPPAAVATATAIAAGAMAGVASRLGLTTAFDAAHLNVTTPTGGLFPALPANVVGAALAGAASAVAAAAAVPRAVVAGIVTGGAGTLTTFASWQVGVTVAMVGPGEGGAGGWAPRVATAVTALMVGVALPLASYFAGHDAGRGVLALVRRRRRRRWLRRACKVSHSRGSLAEEDPSGAGGGGAAEPVRGGGGAVDVDGPLRRGTDTATVGVGGLAVAGVVADVHRQTAASILFAPIGALLRWQLASRLNPCVPSFPLGTFVANLCATAAAAALTAVTTTGTSSLSAGWVLRAAVAGGGGGLSTVSSWVGELIAAESRQAAWVYGTATVGVAQAASLLIYGILWRVRQ